MAALLSPETDAEKLARLGDSSDANNEIPPAITYTEKEERALVREQDLRILPLSAGIYFLCYLDRANIGNARILNNSTNNDMQTEIHATPYQFNIALMVFLIAYALFEVPSNIILKKLRPSRWIAILMFTWGSITIGLGGVNSFASTTGVRFLLGAAEAGLFPGLVYYLTFWYRSSERSVRMAFILASATLGGAFGGAIAFGIGHMNRVGGLSAWRWLFILEGIPSCLAAFAVWFLLPNYPETSLTGRGRDIALARLRVEGSKSHHRSMTRADAVATLCDVRLWCHYALYFAVCVPFSSLSLFTPTITAGLGFRDLKAQLMSVPPYAVAYFVQIAVSWSADRTNERALHTAGLALVGAAGFMASALLPADANGARYGCLIVAAAGAFSCIPPLLGLLTSNVYSTASVGLAIALNVSIGAGLGMIPGVWIYKAEERERGYPTGHWVNAGMLLFAAVGTVALRMWYVRSNWKLVRAGGRGCGCLSCETVLRSTLSGGCGGAACREGAGFDAHT